MKPDEFSTSFFDRVIEPLDRRRFLEEFWSKSFLHQAGLPGRFQKLLPWDVLNSVLEYHDLSERLRMVNNGRAVDRSRFMVPRSESSDINAAGLVNCLSDGATLVLNGVDDLVPTVREVAEAFEEVFRTFVSVNVYAGWRSQNGFDLHWDDHDTVILQVSGRKRWKVFRPTLIHPLRDDAAPATKPDGSPAWEGLLDDGDMLHIPRGWWHVAFPLDEPSLHLTIAVVPATGIDLLQWVTRRLKRHAEVRMNVPHSTDVDRLQYLLRLRELLIESMNESTMGEFQKAWESKIPLRPTFRLPESPLEQGEPITGETLVRLASSRKLSFEDVTDGDQIHFHSDAVRGECSRDLVPALEELDGLRWHPVHQLCSCIPNASAERLKALIWVLSTQGVVWTKNAID